jgi:hypothetical protein
MIGLGITQIRRKNETAVLRDPAVEEAVIFAQVTHHESRIT